MLVDPKSLKPKRFDSGEDLSYKLMPYEMRRRACPGAGVAHHVTGFALRFIDIEFFFFFLWVLIVSITSHNFFFGFFEVGNLLHLSKKIMRDSTRLV